MTLLESQMAYKNHEGETVAITSHLKGGNCLSGTTCRNSSEDFDGAF